MSGTKCVADNVAALLQAVIPPAVRRAERRLLATDAIDPQEAQSHFRALLEFHQDVVTPLSHAFAFALPCRTALNTIAHHAQGRTVVEIGAGNGLWASLLRTQHGLRVEASDNTAAQWPFGKVTCHAQSVSEICRGSGDAVLFLCWPPLETEVAPGQRSASRGGAANTMAADALYAFEGSTVVYVGEWCGRSGIVSSLSSRTTCGQTAGATFQDAIDEGWSLIDRVQLPRWPGFADALHVFTRRETEFTDGGAQTGYDGRRPVVPAGGLHAGTDQPHCGHEHRAEETAGTLPSTAARLRGLCEAGLTQPAVVAAAVLLDQYCRSSASAE